MGGGMGAVGDGLQLELVNANTDDYLYYIFHLYTSPPAGSLQVGIFGRPRSAAISA